MEIPEELGIGQTPAARSADRLIDLSQLPAISQDIYGTTRYGETAASLLEYQRFLLTGRIFEKNNGTWWDAPSTLFPHDKSIAPDLLAAKSLATAVLDGVTLPFQVEVYRPYALQKTLEIIPGPVTEPLLRNFVLSKWQGWPGAPGKATRVLVAAAEPDKIPTLHTKDLSDPFTPYITLEELKERAHALRLNYTIEHVLKVAGQLLTAQILGSSERRIAVEGKCIVRPHHKNGDWQMACEKISLRSLLGLSNHSPFNDLIHQLLAERTE